MYQVINLLNKIFGGMVMKFKNVLLVSIFFILLVSLAACGSKDKDSSEDGGDVASNVEVEAAPAVPFEPIAGEVVSAGNISAVCPEGWFFVPIRDIFSEVADATDPNKLRLIKGTDDDWASVPNVVISFYGAGTSLSSYAEQKTYYDTVVDVNPFTIGDEVWEGISYNLGETSTEVLISKVNDGSYQVTVGTVTNGGSVSLTDADIQTILSSISY